ncbi:MAG: hypothetical protein ACK55I_07190, partial [bacterium]
GGVVAGQQLVGAARGIACRRFLPEQRERKAGGAARGGGDLHHHRPRVTRHRGKAQRPYTRPLKACPRLSTGHQPYRQRRIGLRDAPQQERAVTQGKREARGVASRQAAADGGARLERHGRRLRRRHDRKTNNGEGGGQEGMRARHKGW